METVFLALTGAQAAVVGAGMALFGALVGGAITGFVTLKAEDRRHGHARALEREREEIQKELEERLVLGIAREMQSALRASVGPIRTAVSLGKWWPADLAPVAPSSEDRTAVLSKLTIDEWQSFDQALFHLKHVMLFRSLATRGDMPKLSSAGREVLEESIGPLGRGIAALDRLCRLAPSDTANDGQDSR